MVEGRRGRKFPPMLYRDSNYIVHNYPYANGTASLPSLFTSPLDGDLKLAPMQYRAYMGIPSSKCVSLHKLLSWEVNSSMLSSLWKNE